MLHTAEDFSKGWLLLCLAPSLRGRVEGKARQGKFHFEHRGSNSRDIFSCPPAQGVSRCSAEILGDVASHLPPPRLVPGSVFSGASTRGTFSSYKASLPSLLCSTPGSLGLPPSLWHFPQHPFAQGKFLDAPARHPGHHHKRGCPARGAGWELRCCDRVPRQSLTASPDLLSGNTFFFSCTANVWTGFPGAFGATFRLVPVIPPCWLGREGGSARAPLGFWRDKSLPCPAVLGLKLLRGQDREDNLSKSCWVSAAQWPQEGSLKW